MQFQLGVRCDSSWQWFNLIYLNKEGREAGARTDCREIRSTPDSPHICYLLFVRRDESYCLGAADVKKDNPLT
jgi:hypothetical protein